jgi:anaerobic magnesium-protoporphyrin IX monomethyl ester cyclase
MDRSNRKKALLRRLDIYPCWRLLLNIPLIYTVENGFPTNKPLLTQSDLPIGLAIIATCLKNAGYNPTVFVLTPNQDIDTFINKYIDEFRPKIFCLTAVSTQFPFIMAIAERIKKRDTEIFVLLGGVHATLNPERSIQEPFVDAICIGEGEKAVVELANQIKNGKKPSQINNLWIKNQNGVEKNPISEFIQDLDSIPIIDRSLWSPWVADMNGTTSILIGRGCPYKCSFCCNHAIAKVSAGKYVRYRSPENIIEEINQIIKDNPKIEEIYLEDETLSVNLDYTFDLLRKIESFNGKLAKPIRFGANVSIVKSIIDNQIFLDHLKRANFTSLNFGLESGSERIRKEILRRPPYSNEDIITFCQNVKKWGITTSLYVMMGLPTETFSDYMETIDCVRRCAPDHVYLYIYHPYPGTDLYQIEKDRGLITDYIIHTDSERKTPILDRPGFSKKQVRMEYILFYVRALHGIYPNSRILRLTLGNLLAPHPTLIRILVSNPNLRL